MNYLKSSACVLCCAVFFSLCSCSDAPLNYAGETSESITSTDTNERAYSGLEQVELETPVLNYLGRHDPSEEFTSAFELYRQTYASQYFDSENGYIYPDGSSELIVSRVVSSGQLLDTLTAAIQSDASPDLVDREDNSYPYLMSKNIYEDLTAYMDMTAPQWVDLQEYIERYEYNGKHFYYPWDYNVSPQMLFYNRRLFFEYGIADPLELWSEGEWTWDAFLEDCRRFVMMSGNEDAIGVYGDNIADNFIASAGIMLIDRDESGKLTNNFSAPEAERAAEWLRENLVLTGLAATDYVYYGDAVVDGLAAFRSAERYVTADYLDNLADGEIYFVPFPRDSESEDYFYRADTFGYLVPKGAKNIQGACCFINSCRLSTANEQSSDFVDFSEYPEEVWEMMLRFRSPNDFNIVIDENYCLSDDGSEAVRNMLSEIFDDTSETEFSWADIVEKNNLIISLAIDEINALI